MLSGNISKHEFLFFNFFLKFGAYDLFLGAVGTVPVCQSVKNPNIS